MTLKRYAQGAMLLLMVLIFLSLSALTFTWLKATVDANHFDEQVSTLFQYELPILSWRDSAETTGNLVSEIYLQNKKNDAQFVRIEDLKEGTDTYLTTLRRSSNSASVIQIFTFNPHGQLMPEMLYYAGMNNNVTHLKGIIKPYTLDEGFLAHLKQSLDERKNRFWTDSPIFLEAPNPTLTYWHYGQILYVKEKPVLLIMFTGIPSQLDFSNYLPENASQHKIYLSNSENQFIFATEAMPVLETNLNAFHQESVIDASSHKRLTVYKDRSGVARQIRYSLENGWTLTASLSTTPPPSILSMNDTGPFFAIFVLLLLSLFWAFKTMSDLNRPLETLQQLLSLEPPHSKSPPSSLNPTSSGGEIGELVDTYFLLESHTLQVAKQLEQLSDQLEQEVVQKNKELLLTNDLLKQSVAQADQQQEELDAVNRLLTSNLQLIESGRRRMLSTEKNQSLKYLVSGIAHELNTPVGNAITLSTFIENEIQQTLDYLRHAKNMKKSRLTESLKIVRASLSQIESNVQQAIKIIALIEDLSDVSISKSESPIDLEQFTKWIAQAKTASYNRPINIYIRCQREVRWVITDPSKLKHLLERLIENSLDHGFINGMGEAITIGYFLKKGVLYLEFYDDGEGVAFENRQHLLTPFFSSAFGTHKGLGLNLAYNLCTSYFNGSMSFDFSKVSGLGITCSLPKIQLVKETLP